MSPKFPSCYSSSTMSQTPRGSHFHSYFHLILISISFLFPSHSYFHLILISISFLFPSHSYFHLILISISFLCTSHSYVHLIFISISFLCTSHSYFHLILISISFLFPSHSYFHLILISNPTYEQSPLAVQWPGHSLGHRPAYCSAVWRTRTTQTSQDFQ